MADTQAIGSVSSQDMQKWLQQELADMAKAVELRTKEASELVADYTSAKINPKEAERRFCEIGERWEKGPSGNPCLQRRDRRTYFLRKLTKRAVLTLKSAFQKGLNACSANVMPTPPGKAR